jgi:hypothetical protein
MTHFLPHKWRLRRTRIKNGKETRSPANHNQSEYELIPGKRPGKHIIDYPDANDTRIEVFFKDFSNAEGPRELADGRGPVISLIVDGFEVIRFDCLGDTGHYHIVFARPDMSIDEDTENRLWFYESSIEDQIERAVFEIGTNISYYLQRNPIRQVREMDLDMATLTRICHEARRTALALAQERL